METDDGYPKQRARASLLGFTNTSALLQLEHPVQINIFLWNPIIDSLSRKLV